MLSTVPRPHSGSRIEIGPLLGRRMEASVTLINNRVNCSLVLPGYFGIVTRSSSKRSGRDDLDRQQPIMLAVEGGIATRQPTQRGAGVLVEAFGGQGQIADSGDANRLDRRMIISAEHDLQFGRDQPIGL